MKTMTLTIRDHKGDCLESEVGTKEELNAFLVKQGYPMLVEDILSGDDVDYDGQQYFIAQ